MVWTHLHLTNCTTWTTKVFCKKSV